MADDKKHVYDESKIKTLSSLEHIRLYTGGWRHFVWPEEGRALKPPQDCQVTAGPVAFAA